MRVSRTTVTLPSVDAADAIVTPQSPDGHTPLSGEFDRHPLYRIPGFT